MTQIDKIISEVNSLGEKEKILLFHKIEEMFNDFDDKEDKNITIESAFGLWEGRDTTKGDLRKKTWKQNYLLERTGIDDIQYI